jgi:O-antigen ligase/tetratricopeptide (TPR) repeat protein
VTLGCSVLIGLYGFGQRLGLQFLLPASDANRMSSTLGNAIFLSVYALLHVFLALWVMSCSENKGVRIMTALIAIFNLIVVFFTVTRTAILVLVLSIIFYLFYLFLSRKQAKFKKSIISALIIIMVLIVGGLVFLQTQQQTSWIKNAPSLVNRLAFLTSNFSDRTTTWGIALKGFAQKPIFGWGWENYNVVFNQYYPPQFLAGGETNTWFDKSHNQITDLLALTGLLGTFAYLLLWVMLVRIIFKKIRSSTDNGEKLSWFLLFLMLLVYFIQNLTVFDAPAPLIMFYFSLALVYFMSTEQKEPTPSVPSHAHSSKNPLLLIIILLVVVVVCFLIYNFNIKPFKRSTLGLEAKRIAQNNFKNGIALYQNTLASPSFINPEIRLQLARTILLARSDQVRVADFQQGFNLAVAEAKKNTTEHPHDARYWLTLAKLYSLASNNDLFYAQQAEQAITTGIPLSPKRQQFYFELSQVKINKGQLQEGIESAKAALSFDESIPVSHYYLATAYFQNKQNDLALQELKMAEFNAEPAFLLNLADVYASLSLYSQSLNNRYDLALEAINQTISHPAFNFQPLGFKINTYTQKISYLQKIKDLTGVQKALNELEKIDAGAAQQLRAKLSI